jgi:transcriptional regulator with XRE-family HTH domain
MNTRVLIDGLRLRVALVIRGVSARGLGARLGLSCSTIGTWIRGTRRPRREMVECIEDVLHLHRGYLLPGEGGPDA